MSVSPENALPLLFGLVGANPTPTLNPDPNPTCCYSLVWWVPRHAGPCHAGRACAGVGWACGRSAGQKFTTALAHCPPTLTVAAKRLDTAPKEPDRYAIYRLDPNPAIVACSRPSRASTTPRNAPPLPAHITARSCALTPAPPLPMTPADHLGDASDSHASVNSIGVRQPPRSEESGGCRRPLPTSGAHLALLVASLATPPTPRAPRHPPPCLHSSQT